jgi:hypothetical protein
LCHYPRHSFFRRRKYVVPSPHRMCRRRSHALTLFSQWRKPSPQRKRLFLVTQAIPPPGNRSTRRARNEGRGARARVPEPTGGHPTPLLARCARAELVAKESLAQQRLAENGLLLQGGEWV